MSGFRERGWEACRKSPIVLAFDPPREVKMENVVDLFSSLRGVVSGIKVGLPALLNLGPQVLTLPKLFDDFMFIFDVKFADVEHIGKIVATKVFNAGFDAIIVQAFVGFRGALSGVIAEKGEKGVLTVCSMSHAGSSEFIDKHTLEFLSKSWEAGADGFVLPAQKPDLISFARSHYPEALIFSPGVGAQGVPPGVAVSSGGNFEIIGRSILEAPNPREVVEKMLREVYARG